MFVKSHLMKHFFYLSLVLILFSSCKAYKQVAYFQGLEEHGGLEEAIKNYSTLKIQKDDMLAITVASMNSEASALFNLGASVGTSSGGSSSPSSTPTGYLVDQTGSIQLPFLGKIKVEGLSTTEIGKLLEDELKQYLKDPIVTARLTNFKISILGDVTTPGVYPVQGERISLVEALSMAGDLSITGMRKNVLLIRENNGKREFVRLDLNDKNIFNSPYYYLRPNDALYIQPSSAKYAGVDNTTRNLSFLLSTVSILLVIFTQLK
jgi:polysaccharide export outer membrane protein